MSVRPLPAGQSRDYSITEDSSILKMITAIPLLGLIPAIIVGDSLSSKAVQTRDPEYLAELLRVDRDYNTASTIRTLLTIATLVTCVATGVMCTLSAFLFCCTFITINLISRVVNSNNSSSRAENLRLSQQLQDARRLNQVR